MEGENFSSKGLPPPPARKEKMKIIIDTDLGGDCDDVGALAVACNLAKAGKTELLAVTYCIGNPWGGYFTRYELDYFGFKDVPLGTLKDENFMSAPNYAKYSKPFCEKYQPQHPETEDATRVLRRTLAGNSGVTLVAIGPLRNISNLLESDPDDISPLNGIELVKESVVEFVTMLGSFDRPDYTEWNILMDIKSAQNVIEKMPVPIVFSPHELGSHIFTGQLNETLPEGHPVREAYWLYSDKKSYIRQSWDLITVYAAVTGSKMWKRRATSAMIDDRGCCKELQIDCQSRKMYVLEQTATDEEITNSINFLMA